MENQDRKIVLEDGIEYYGIGFGSKEDKICEIVFNTSPVGYQEIISDPSYTYQAVVMTYPVIGNYGITEEDFESSDLTISGLVVRDYVDTPSNFRCVKTLGEVMEEYGIAGISGIDTRKLTRSIRDYGSRKALITSADKPHDECMKILDSTEVPRDGVRRVSCKKKWLSRTTKPRYNVVAFDFGIKHNIIRSLNKCGCNVTVLPYNTPANEVLAMNPDGIFLSNGPGDPSDLPEVVEQIKLLIGKKPIFGICLGHQLLSLAYGGKTYKLKFGHRGGNHPVKSADRIEITSQNHSFAVDAKSLPQKVQVTHVNILDGTVEGMECDSDNVFSVQYHPESAPGPQDSGHLFTKFIKTMEKVKYGKAD